MRYYIVDSDNFKLYETNDFDDAIIVCVDLEDRECYNRLYIIDNEKGLILSV